MKRWMALLGVVLAAGVVLAGCGSSGGDEQAVDLESFWTEELSKYQWGDGYFAELDEEMTENYYPGLQDVPAEQRIIQVPMMSAVVNEYVFMECRTEEDAGQAAEILQKRVDDQADGGAWYPESMESWKQAQVITQGRYVAMIASAEAQEAIAGDFNALFA